MSFEDLSNCFDFLSDQCIRVHDMVLPDYASVDNSFSSILQMTVDIIRENLDG